MADGVNHIESKSFFERINPTILISPLAPAVQAGYSIFKGEFSDTSKADVKKLEGTPVPKLTTDSYHGLNSATFWGGVKMAGTKLTNSYYKDTNYSMEEDKGIAPRVATDTQVQLARVGSKVAADMHSRGNCYTGVKHSLLTLGVIKDYGDMPKGSASNANKFFEEKTEIFEEIKDLAPSRLKALPAGAIVVFSKKGKDGHIGIANGKGQLYSDTVDDTSWYDFQGGAKAGASYRVFKLKDDLQIDKTTGKIILPRVEEKK